MQWWAWITVGAILLGAELAFVDAQFYLVFLGVAALIVGFLDLWGGIAPVWLQWLAFAGFASLSMIAFRRRIYDRLRRDLPVMNQGPVGDSLVLNVDLPPGATCRVEFRGSSWNASNGGRFLIAAGTRASVVRIEGLTLVIVGGQS